MPNYSLYVKEVYKITYSLHAIVHGDHSLGETIPLNSISISKVNYRMIATTMAQGEFLCIEHHADIQY